MKRARFGWMLLLPAACLAWNAAAQGAGGDASVATVGPLPVPRSEWSARVEQARTGYRQRTGSPVPEEMQPMLRRSVLEQLIRTRLLALQAEKEGRLVSRAEAEEELKKSEIFTEGGTFSPTRYEALKRANPKAWEDAMRDAQRRLSAARLMRDVERRHAPDEAALRAAIQRDLSEATIEALLLPAAEFDGEGREPSEAEVLAYYRANPRAFERPARAMLTVLEIPAPMDAAGEETRTEIDLARGTAERLLEQMQGGGTLETVAESGRLIRDVEVRRDNFPGLWRGGSADEAALFSAAPGAHLPAPVRGRDGWLVVRVDAVSQRGPAPLEDVAEEIRERLRVQLRGSSDAELRALYAERRASLAGPAANVRYAFFDTARIDPGTPSGADLDRYYRAHLADYSTFDAARGEVRQRPLDEVRDQVRMRWAAEQRVIVARAHAEALLDAWSRGRGDRRAERVATILHDAGRVTVGAPVDSTRFGALLRDSLAARDGAPGAGIVQIQGGVLVFRIDGRVEDHVPPFEAVRGVLAFELEQRRAADEEAAARALYDADPYAFARDSLIYFTRIVVPLPNPIDVPLTRQEVERHYRENIDKYSAPELVGARQVLISPSGPGPGPDQAARIRAEGLLRRIQAGEDIADIARAHSDDMATRDVGGDLGTFGRGILPPEVERVVFEMRPGDLSGLVKSPRGYHILRCTAYEPMHAQPLVLVYTNVGFEAALEKGHVIARERADSLLRTIRGPEDFERKSQLPWVSRYLNQRTPGTSVGVPDLAPYFRRLDEMKPGEIYPGSVLLKGQGYVLTRIDSIAPPQRLDYTTVREQVLAEYRRQAAARVLLGKRAELDSLERRGWSVDSLAKLFGGMRRFEHLAPGEDLPGFGGGSQLDSLLFGRSAAPALDPGETSGWVVMAGGLGRIRLVERDVPSTEQIAGRLERDRRKELDRNLFFYFEELKRDFRVRIQDQEMAELSMPPPTGAFAP